MSHWRLVLVLTAMLGDRSQQCVGVYIGDAVDMVLVLKQSGELIVLWCVCQCCIGAESVLVLS